MALTRLEISRLRNIERATLDPSTHINVLIGDNGSGKTSVLEAVYLLGRGRSFRTTHASQIVQLQQSELVVTGVVHEEPGPRTPLGVRLTRQERELLLAGQRVQSSAELVRAFPVLVIHPSSASLLDAPPKLRRQFLDWGVFHVEPSYLDNWRRYTKALNHRNALLKQRRPADLGPWNQEVARYGTMLAKARGQYLLRLQPHLDDVLRHFFSGCLVRIEHAQGWKPDRTLLQVLCNDLSPDLEYGYTQSGPHKGDFTVYVNDKLAKTYLSRGQAKLMVYALLLAQSNLLDRAAQPICLLIDDVASELDRNNRKMLLDLLLQRQAQCFVTAAHQDDVRFALADNATMFHVEHGRISHA